MPNCRFSLVAATGEPDTTVEAVCGDDAAALRCASALLRRESRCAVEVWRAAEYLGTLGREPPQATRRTASVRAAHALPFIHGPHRVLQ
jgi:hypothetical protein